jgi:hypothetical protein
MCANIWPIMNVLLLKVLRKQSTAGSYILYCFWWTNSNYQLGERGSCRVCRICG